MGYELFGRLHAALAGLREERGQGTIEYVGIIMLMAVVLAAVASFAGAGDEGGKIAKTVVDKLKGAIDGIGAGEG